MRPTFACVGIRSTDGQCCRLSKATQRSSAPATHPHDLPALRPRPSQVRTSVFKRCPALRHIHQDTPPPKPCQSSQNTPSGVHGRSPLPPCTQEETQEELTCLRPEPSLPWPRGRSPGSRAFQSPDKDLTCSSCCQICCNWQRQSGLQIQPPRKKISELPHRSTPETGRQEPSPSAA